MCTDLNVLLLAGGSGEAEALKLLVMLGRLTVDVAVLSTKGRGGMGWNGSGEIWIQTLSRRCGERAANGPSANPRDHDGRRWWQRRRRWPHSAIAPLACVFRRRVRPNVTTPHRLNAMFGARLGLAGTERALTCCVHGGNRYWETATPFSRPPGVHRSRSENPPRRRWRPCAPTLATATLGESGWCDGSWVGLECSVPWRSG